MSSSTSSAASSGSSTSHSTRPARPVRSTSNPQRLPIHWGIAFSSIFHGCFREEEDQCSTGHPVDGFITPSARQVLQQVCQDIGTYVRDVRHDFGIHSRKRPQYSNKAVANRFAGLSDHCRRAQNVDTSYVRPRNVNRRHRFHRCGYSRVN